MSPSAWAGLQAVRTDRRSTCSILGILFLIGLFAGCGGGSTSKPAPDDPPAPVDLEVGGVGPFADTLCWEPNRDADFSRYEIYRSPDRETSWMRLATLEEPTDSIWVDAYVSPHRNYLYRVDVSDLAGQVTPSNIAELTTLGYAGLAIGIEPRILPNTPADSLEFELWIEGASELFGAVVEFEVTSGIVLGECQPGELLGENSLFLCMEEPTIWTLSMTRVAGTGGVSGYGILAEILAVGRVSDLQLPETAILVREDGSAVPGIDTLFVAPVCKPKDPGAPLAGTMCP